MTGTGEVRNADEDRKSVAGKRRTQSPSDDFVDCSTLLSPPSLAYAAVRGVSSTFATSRCRLRCCSQSARAASPDCAHGLPIVPNLYLLSFFHTISVPPQLSPITNHRCQQSYRTHSWLCHSDSARAHLLTLRESLMLSRSLRIALDASPHRRPAHSDWQGP